MTIPGYDNWKTIPPDYWDDDSEEEDQKECEYGGDKCTGCGKCIGFDD